MMLAPGTSLLTLTVGTAVAATPQGPNDDKVSPGLAGFITVFLLALAVLLLSRSMVKHLRNVRYGPGPPGGGPATGKPAGPEDGVTPDAATPDEPGP